MYNFAPKISVIIPAFNAARTLPDAVQSVVEQSYRVLEIIIVDDCSTDETGELAVIKYPSVKYLRSARNEGGSVARNVGVAEAKGDWVAFLDADDVWARDKLMAQVESIAASQVQSIFSVTNYRVVGGKGDGKTNRRAMYDGEPVTHYMFGTDGNSIQCSSFLLPTEAARRHPFRQETVPHDDWDFLIRQQKSGLTIQYLHEVLVDYRDHSFFARVSKEVNPEPSLKWIRELWPSLSSKERVGIYVNTLYSRRYYRQRPFFMLWKVICARYYGVISTKRMLSNSARIVFGNAGVHLIEGILSGCFLVRGKR